MDVVVFMASDTETGLGLCILQILHDAKFEN